MKTYPAAPMDRFVAFSTPGYVGAPILAWLSALVLMTLAVVGVGRPPAVLYGLGGFMAIFGALTAIPIFFWKRLAPVRYEISEDSIAIRRGGWPFRDILIPLGEVRDIRRVNLPWFSIFRCCSYGTNGVFAYVAYYRDKQLGKFFRASTSLKNELLITGQRQYVISPERPDEFVADVKEAISR